ncbi:hypothetical protein OX284_015970 [Flavobacterium sp. SUN046]|uniref:hypothetical protein n=1 Tax=Flavobacterium sp. SUN046 TaxID=3002440 RepID=UPI002DBB90D6|nr:hypothetical protein [Flavobacterium sp. SUN046]MEC4050934.1 hypothetical protein [Flavobacterium sp. SUN046]
MKKFLSNINLHTCKLILLLTLSFYVNKSNGQSFLDKSISSNNYSMSSPDVNSFEKYSLNKVNYYVGKTDVNIPIYTINSGNIKYPINLVYNTGGIKVDQLASDVGLGWNLTSTIITRTINQDNDFDNLGNLDLQPDVSIYPAEDKIKDSQVNYKKVGYFLQKQTTNAFLTIGAENSVDFIPDMYHFYSNNNSFNFFFNDILTPIETEPNGNNIAAIVNYLKIDTNRGYYDLTTKDFFNIYITTNDGIKYTFSDCDFAFNQVIAYYNETISPAQISAWHITKIEDLKSGKKIDFVYENTSSNPNSPGGAFQNISQLQAQRTFAYSVNTSFDFLNGNFMFYNNSFLAPIARIDALKKRLIKIIFDEGEINFNYNNKNIPSLVFTRNDILNGDCVTNITVKNNLSDTVKSFDFNYNYFNSNYNVGEFNPDQNSPNNPYRYQRLKLVSAGETGKPLNTFTYDESHNLPPINSFSINFLGYYNNSPDIAFLNSISDPKPNLYYYQNQFDKSILPYNISNMNPITIPGYFNREANQNSKFWSLIRIDYPTAGYAEYIYESNQFEENGQNILGGGVRIAQQNINDGKGNIRTFNYSYLKNNSSLSSGKLFSHPFFGNPTSGDFNYNINFQPDGLSPTTINSFGDNTSLTFQIYDKSFLNEDITSGAFVGYSRIVESEPGNGRKEFKFTSSDIPGFQNFINRFPPELLPQQYTQIFNNGLLFTGRLDPITGELELNSNGFSKYAIGNSAIFSDVFTDNSYKRGKILEELIYEESNQLLKKTTYNYTENLINSYTFHQGFVQIVPKFDISHYIAPNNPAWCIRVDDVFYCDRDFRSYLRDNSEAFVTARKDIKIAQFYPTSIITSFYDTNNNKIDEVTNLSYTTFGSINTKVSYNSNGDTFTSKFYYPLDPSLSTEPYIYDIIYSNSIGIPLKTETFKNNEKISEVKTSYARDSSTNNLLLPKFNFSKKGTDLISTLELNSSLDLYDNKGNVLQFTKTNGPPISIIWGYNKTLPVAIIENINYNTIAAFVTQIQTATDAIPYSDTQVLQELAILRNSPLVSNSLITTYTHKPLVGILTQTDPKGNQIKYQYDNLGRLNKIFDKYGNIISENEYNYKH